MKTINTLQLHHVKSTQRITPRALAFVLFLSLGFFNAQANEDSNPDSVEISTKKPISAHLCLEIRDVNGWLKGICSPTVKNPTLNFDLQPFPVGKYYLRVLQDGVTINTTNLVNVSSDPSVVTVEILNKNEQQVYESSQSYQAFNLEPMPKGTYNVYIYQGQELINSHILQHE